MWRVDGMGEWMGWESGWRCGAYLTYKNGISLTYKMFLIWTIILLFKNASYLKCSVVE